MLEVAALMTLLAVSPLIAQEGSPTPGTAQGELKRGGQGVILKVAKAHLHDNLEGILDSPKELRILLADQDVPAGSLDGLVFLPVDRLAQAGRVQGLLIKMDPADTSKALVTVLWKPSKPGESLMTQTLMNTGKGVFQNFRLEGGRVTGEIRCEAGAEEGGSALEYQVAFSAPVEAEPPVTADLRGPAAQASPQVKALKASIQAILKGDMAGARNHRTAEKNAELDGFMAQAGAQAAQFLKQMTQEMSRTLKDVDRVVVRGNHAVALWRKGGRSLTFVQVEGAWKMD